MRDPTFFLEWSTDSKNPKLPVRKHSLYRLIIPHLIVFLLLAEVATFGGCTSDEVVKDKARAMSTPGLGPDQFATPPPRQEGLNVGDQVQISVLGYPEFNTTAYVKQTGTITVPLIGELKALGLTKDLLSEQLISKLSEYVKSKVYVTVTVTGQSIQKVIVLGAVGQQGAYPTSIPTSIFQVLANAGGTSEGADLGHIRVYRNAELSQLADVDLSAFVFPGTQGVQEVPLVYPGDLVYVPKQENLMQEFSGFLRDIILLLGFFSLIG